MRRSATIVGVQSEMASPASPQPPPLASPADGELRGRTHKRRYKTKWAQSITLDSGYVPTTNALQYVPPGCPAVPQRCRAALPPKAAAGQARLKGKCKSQGLRWRQPYRGGCKGELSSYQPRPFAVLGGVQQTVQQLPGQMLATLQCVQHAVPLCATATLPSADQQGASGSTVPTERKCDGAPLEPKSSSWSDALCSVQACTMRDPQKQQQASKKSKPKRNFGVNYAGAAPADPGVQDEPFAHGDTPPPWTRPPPCSPEHDFDELFVGSSPRGSRSASPEGARSTIPEIDSTDESEIDSTDEPDSMLVDEWLDREGERGLWTLVSDLYNTLH